MSEVEILHEGEVGPELEEYINSLLDRNRELQKRVAELERKESGFVWDYKTITEYINTKHGGKI